LDGNPIDEIGSGIFQTLASLSKFSVIGWNLEELDLSLFESAHLTSLQIQDNTQLRAINVSNTEISLGSLTKIVLNSNNLTDIDRSIGALLAKNENLMIHISNESNFNCYFEIDRVIDFENITNSTDQIDDSNRLDPIIDESVSPLQWLADLAACDYGNRIVIDENNVLCAKENDTAPSVSLLSHLKAVGPKNCKIAPITMTSARPPMTTSGSERLTFSYQTIFSSVFFLVGILVSMKRN